jgi:hypothetical protein
MDKSYDSDQDDEIIAAIQTTGPKAVVYDGVMKRFIENADQLRKTTKIHVKTLQNAIGAPGTVTKSLLVERRFLTHQEYVLKKKLVLYPYTEP